MDLNLNLLTEKIIKNEFVQNFIKELGEVLENYNKKEKGLESKDMDDMELTTEEELEFDRKEFNFLQDYFKKEMSDLSKGEIYMVTNKYENDDEFHRYKVAQYKDNLECKYIAFEKDLPQSVQLRDIVRKIDGKYIYDEQATRICEGWYKSNKKRYCE